MRKLTKTVMSIALVSGFFLACQPEEKLVYVRDSSDFEAQSCKSINDYSIDKSKALQFDSIELLRQKQIVRRIDCSGNLLSEKIEEVKSPRSTLLIKSLKKLDEKNSKFRQQILDSIKGEGFNRQTCNPIIKDPIEEFLLFPVKLLLDAGKRFGKTPNQASMEITIDYSPTTFTTEVDSGVQMLDYKFTKVCSTENQNGKSSRRNVAPSKTNINCGDIFEEGTLVLAVQYRVETLPGVKIVEVCKPN